MDENGELRLPDDLAALADRLRADADHLAARYRPDGTVDPPADIDVAPARRPRSSVRRPAATGLTLALLLLAVGLAWPLVNGRWGGDGPHSESRESVAPEIGLAERLTTPPSHDAGEEGRPEALPAPIEIPAGMFYGVSDPELEGLLDAWESETRVRLSM